jgi:hypothetical protein
MFVHRLAMPIDDFDGLTPLNHWLADASPSRTVWAMTAILALADASSDIRWRGDMRHMPMVGVLPTSNQTTTPYLIVKQDGNGTTFIITDAPPDHIDQPIASTEVTTRTIGSWEPTPPDNPDTTPHF